MQKPGLLRAVMLGGFLSSLASCAFWDLDDWAGDATPNSDGGVPEGSSNARDASDAQVDAPNAYAAVILADKPIAYWPLEESAGATSAKDLGPNGQDGTPARDITFGEPGIAGSKAVRFRSGTIVVPVALPSGAFSLEAWVKPVTLDNGYRRIASIETSTAPRQGYAFWARAAGTGFEQIVNGSGTTVPASTLPTSRFSHVVATYDGQRGQLYIDGQSSSGPLAASVPSFTGRFQWGQSDFTNAAFDGWLDELAVYDVALSPTQVDAHYRAGR